MTVTVSVTASISQAPQSVPLRTSSPGEFLQAVRMDRQRPNGEPLVVARSYNGNGWEAIPDADAVPATFNCSPSGCLIEGEGSYELRVLDVPEELVAPAMDSQWSRLMMQATFGLTADELEQTISTFGSDLAAWVANQLTVPLTSHRAYFRQRTNARRFTGSEIGSLYQPCEVGARYHRFAFNFFDTGKPLEVRNDGPGPALALYINGDLRTELDNFNGIEATNTSVTFPLEFVVCAAVEAVGGAMLLDDGTGECDVDFTNPAIQFSNSDAANIQALPATFLPVQGAPGAVVVETISNIPCPLPSVNAFLSEGGQFYRFDPRIKLLRNSLQEPVAVEAEGGLTCPAVVKTFLNEDSCIHRASCAPLTFTSAQLLLDEGNIRAWYTNDRIYVYEIRDLRLEEPYDVSPCNGTSRWLRLSDESCTAPTAFPDDMTRQTFEDALASSSDTNPFVRDISLPGTDCTPAAITIGAQVNADGKCFQHVHPELYNVYDFSYWARNHDGNARAAEFGRPNPIVRWAEQGFSYLQYPDHHLMTRWDQRKQHFTLIGRLGDSLSFSSLPTGLQTEAMAERVGAIATRSDEGFEVCGSPHELENRPELGDRYHLSDNTESNGLVDTDSSHYFVWTAKTTLWFNAVLSSPDHLRQRVAWALAQIIPVADDVGFGDKIELWTSFYDIFVRNAFGNYRDVLREVSYSHVMSQYLSFYRNRGFSRSGTYPDENYAREIMQLFSVGLWKLNPDGTQQLDETGQPIATYTNADILDFARLWTGFDVQQFRGNVEPEGENFYNTIDPSQIKPDLRDVLPKAKLDAGYLGDHYPLCSLLPPHHWLLPGARFVFTGGASAEGPTMDAQDPEEAGYVGRFAPEPSSALYQVLCAVDTNTGECTFPTEVVLDQALACDSGIECQVATITTVAMYDAVADVTKYYSYRSVPCVKLSFFGDGKVTAHYRTSLQCAPASQPAAIPLCCSPTNRNNPTQEIARQICSVTNEATDFATALDRCTAIGLTLCVDPWGGNWKSACAENMFYWSDRPCQVAVQVAPSGQVNIVDEHASENSEYAFSAIQESSNNLFRVRWENGAFPQVSTNCAPGCRVASTLAGASCLCNVTVTESAVFIDPNALPTQAEALDRLFQGALAPALYPATYQVCTSCSSPEGVQAWTTVPGVLDESTIFEVAPVLAGGRIRFLFNRQSIVSVADFAFRNPPRFLQGVGDMRYPWVELTPWTTMTPGAEEEVEALLDHLFEHESTAPFVVYRLIQRLTTSNPSPRYIRTAVEAFRTGTYDGQVFSGRYGDLAATVVAILLDPEARTPMLEADPTFGALREPLLKVMQVLNYQELVTLDGGELTISQNLFDLIGMAPFKSPSVFGFYLPDHRPDGPLNDLALVSPEAQLAITPKLFGMLNGFMTLVDYQFTDCSFGSGYGWCGRPENLLQAETTYQPDDLTDAAAVVDELNLLLTGRRINAAYLQHILNDYEATLISSTPDAAFKRAQKLILLSPEFHVSSAHQEASDSRPETPEVPSTGQAYKAIVVIIEEGGADSFNFLVPHSNCGSFDLNAEYEAVREGAAIPKNELLTITVPSGTQPCNTFGLHPAFPTVQSLYEDDQALLFANLGALVEPITKEDYFARPLLKELPPSLFAHNIMTRSTQNLHPQNSAAAGVLGRAVKALRSQGQTYSSEMYSLVGSTKILEGTDAHFISTSGVIEFEQYDQLAADITNMTTAMSQSPLTETYLSLLSESLSQTEEVGNLLNSVTLDQTFPNNHLGRQLKQVAKFIHLRDQLETERDVFVVATGGFDTHATFDLEPLLSPIDNGIATLRAEMEYLGLWDSVSVMTISEFGRTLTSNGAGTDHGWGGNHFLVGGAVDGGRILGHYPDRLTEEGDTHIGRGRLLPTTGWDAVWNGLLQWFGVEQAQMGEVLPNLPNFPPEDLFTQAQLFQ